MSVQRRYRLNLRNYGNPPIIMISQYDEGYNLVFDIYDGTSAADDLSAYTVKLRGIRYDELSYEFTGTVSTNTLSFTIDTTMSACAGRGTAEIAILDTGNNVEFATFNILVYVEKAAVPDGSIDADVERAEEIAAQVQGIVDTAAETVEASLGTLSNLTTTDKTSVVAAINEVDADVSTLKEDLDGTASNILSPMPTASPVWMSGTIATSGVANSTDVKRIRNSGGSTMPKAVKGDVIYVKYPYKARVIAYNASQLSSTNFYAVIQSDFVSGLIPIDDAYIGKYIGIAIKDSTQEDFDISSAISTIGNYVKLYRPSEYLDDINADLENVNQWIMAVDTDTEDETGKTDMASAITTMLTDTGYCHLGEGIFYVSGIDMPEGSKLEGCGKATEIRLLQSSASTYCIKMDKYCTISDLQVTGSYSTPTISSQGTRSGIAFMANFDGDEGDTTYNTEHCMINNVWVSKFTNSGILCHNTSQTYRRGLHAVNVMVQQCWCGVNIDYISEFNKFTNLLVAICIRGCMNNGGNNVFTACTFYGTQIGYYVDGSQPNSAHGTINGCTFCHSGSSTGSAITMSNVTSGFVVSACQIHYNSIDLTDCSGISFVGCEFGRGTTGAGATINIDGGNLVLFIGCTFVGDDQYAPDITITDNTKVKFDSCYGSVTGNAISA